MPVGCLLVRVRDAQDGFLIERFAVEQFLNRLGANRLCRNPAQSNAAIRNHAFSQRNDSSHRSKYFFLREC